MNCVICRNGTTRPGTTSVTLERGASVIVVREVPADVCDNCSEPFVSNETAKRILQQAEEAVQRGAEIEVVGFAA